MDLARFEQAWAGSHHLEQHRRPCPTQIQPRGVCPKDSKSSRVLQDDSSKVMKGRLEGDESINSAWKRLLGRSSGKMCLHLVVLLLVGHFVGVEWGSRWRDWWLPHVWRRRLGHSCPPQRFGEAWCVQEKLSANMKRIAWPGWPRRTTPTNQNKMLAKPQKPGQSFLDAMNSIL